MEKTWQELNEELKKEIESLKHVEQEIEIFVPEEILEEN